MTDVQNIKVEKKAYAKPQVTEVRMVAGEAVLASCKTGPSGVSGCIPPDTRCGSSAPRS
jgi:hypothetical protein